MGRFLFFGSFLITIGCIVAASKMATLEGQLICLGGGVLLGAVLVSRGRQLLARR